MLRRQFLPRPLRARRDRGRRAPRAVALLLAALAACQDPPLSLGPGVQAPRAPRQTPVEARVIDVRGARLTERADFHIRAKILSKRRYRWDDLAALAPWDFALGWGPASDEALLGSARVIQGDRFMFWHLYDSPLAPRTAERSSANIHLIPENPRLRVALGQIPEGAIVELSGRLVDVTLADGSLIRTSLSRRDVGAGACEILHVSAVKVVREAPSRG